MMMIMKTTTYYLKQVLSVFINIHVSSLHFLIWLFSILHVSCLFKNRISKINKKEKVSPLLKNKCLIMRCLVRLSNITRGGDIWVWTSNEIVIFKNPRSKTFSIATSPTTNLICSHKALNPGFRDVKPASNYLNYGTPSKRGDLSFFCTSLCRLEIRGTFTL
jgi:hypothetical protein